jgi:mannitol-specific phosphotransferase system IIBC component
MPEFVVVTFLTRRRVFMDDQPMGSTGERLTVQAGFHDFDLGSPADYTPPTQNVNVLNTTPSDPMIVPFAPVMAVVEEPVAAELIRENVRLKRAISQASVAEKAKKAKKKTSRKKKAKRAAPKKSVKRTAVGKIAFAKKAGKTKAAKKK